MERNMRRIGQGSEGDKSETPVPAMDSEGLFLLEKKKEMI
jgi:hypothetical protein